MASVMRLGSVPFLASMLALLACNDPSDPPQGGDSSSTAAASSTSEPPADSTTGSLDTTAAGSGSATGSSSSSGTTSTLDGTSSSSGSSSGPGESSSSGSESTGPAPVNGCADGEREVLEDEALYPNIAGCAGAWTVPGVVVNVTNCERQGGDDGLIPTGTECSVEDLCSEGWHVCVDRQEVMDDGVADCNDDTLAWNGSFYATRQSGQGSNTCDAFGLNDVFGCGDVGYDNITNCAPLNRGSANLCVELPAPWACGVANDQEAQFIVKTGPEFGGVLCCLD